VEIAAGQVQGVGKDQAGVAQVGQGDGEKEIGRGDAVIVPSFEAEGLEGAEPVKVGLLQVAVQERLPGPTYLDQVALLVQQRGGRCEFALHRLGLLVQKTASDGDRVVNLLSGMPLKV